jgi:flagellar biosynthesis protein FlhA
LTVGDGLVSQIPALLLSIATGLTVTRAATDDILGKELGLQVASNPRVVMIAAGALVVLGLVPGLPAMPFLVLSGLLGMWGFRLTQAPEPTLEEQELEEAPVPEEADTSDPESVLPLLSVEPLETELGMNLLQLTEGVSDGDLLDRVAALRRQLALELGLVVPLVRIRDNLSLNPDEYRIKLFGVPVAEGTLKVGKLLAMGPEDTDLEGDPTEEPAFGLPAYWINPEQQLEAEVQGFTVVEPAAVLTTHLSEVLKGHAGELVTRQQTHKLLDLLREEAPDLVEELIPEQVTVGQLQQVLQNLLDEGVSVRNLSAIMEALGEAVGVTQDPAILTEYARQALKRQISHELPMENGTLHAITLDPQLEESLRSALDREDGRLHLNISP